MYLNAFELLVAAAIIAAVGFALGERSGRNDIRAQQEIDKARDAARAAVPEGWRVGYAEREFGRDEYKVAMVHWETQRTGQIGVGNSEASAYLDLARRASDAARLRANELPK